MKLDGIESAGEAAGVALVVATLIFFAIHIKQSTEISQSDAH